MKEFLALFQHEKLTLLTSNAMSYNAPPPPQVNGVNVAELNIHEVLALLTGPDKHISLVLYREPSVTLL